MQVDEVVYPNPQALHSSAIHSMLLTSFEVFGEYSYGCHADMIIIGTASWLPHTSGAAALKFTAYTLPRIWYKFSSPS